MSERFPALELDKDSRTKLEEEVHKIYGSNPNFTWKGNKGAPIGPFAILA